MNDQGELTDLERQFVYERRGDLEASVIRKLDLESVRDKSLDSGGE